MSDSRLVNRNIVSALGRTSIRLEPELWDALGEICRREHMSLTETIHQVEATQQLNDRAGGRTSAIRVHIVDYFRAAGTEAGHQAAGHGPIP